MYIDHTYHEDVYSAILTSPNTGKNQEANKVPKDLNSYYKISSHKFIHFAYGSAL